MSLPPHIHPVSPERHRQQRWKGPDDYRFAAAHTLLPLVHAELARAALAMPIAFAAHDGTTTPVALVGLTPGKNLLVGTDGRWLGGYIPAALRGHPFMLVRTDADQGVLCVDESGGLVGEQGEPFFSDDAPAPRLKKILEFLSGLERARPATVAACAALATHGVLKPWRLTLQGTGGARQEVQGLMRVDEEALNTLADAAFLELRKSGALAVAYAHFISLQHMPQLAQLAQAHEKSAAAVLPVTAGGDLDLSFMERDGTLRF